jgi:hypothetical protein
MLGLTCDMTLGLCVDIDECEQDKYICTETDKTGIPDHGCVNWPKSYKCIDAALQGGVTTGSW